jgi:hypothetical protein
MIESTINSTHTHTHEYAVQYTYCVVSQSVISEVCTYQTILILDHLGSNVGNQIHLMFMRVSTTNYNVVLCNRSTTESAKWYRLALSATYQRIIYINSKTRCNCRDSLGTALQHKQEVQFESNTAHNNWHRCNYLQCSFSINVGDFAISTTHLGGKLRSHTKRMAELRLTRNRAPNRW